MLETDIPLDFTALVSNFKTVRQLSLELCSALSEEDMQIQSMPDTSPLKWHLAHTSWAFETFILKVFISHYEPFDPQYEYLFNSYYNAIGKQFLRSQRGLLSRPSYQTILDYRQTIDKAMIELLSTHAFTSQHDELIKTTQLMLNHEQQHQELMITDIKHALSINPSYPVYKKNTLESNLHSKSPSSSKFDSFDQLHWPKYKAGIQTIGHDNEGFYFDNEGPPHHVYLESFQMASRLVTCREYLLFIENGGYQQSEFWLSEAWYKISQNQQMAPLYWIKKRAEWYQYTLSGLRPLDLDSPVMHINYFEASAYANSVDKRLPTEQEWEVAAKNSMGLSDNSNKNENIELNQMFNTLWQWTSSSYNAYPGFKVPKGAIGEYNGKFMVNQYVLRGGSIATPTNHIRPSYRNFFYPDAAWQFTGIRLAESL